MVGIAFRNGGANFAARHGIHPFLLQLEPARLNFGVLQFGLNG